MENETSQTCSSSAALNLLMFVRGKLNSYLLTETVYFIYKCDICELYMSFCSNIKENVCVYNVCDYLTLRTLRDSSPVTFSVTVGSFPLLYKLNENKKKK